jgi:hypothetical protein
MISKTGAPSVRSTTASARKLYMGNLDARRGTGLRVLNAQMAVDLWHAAQELKDERPRRKGA